jgi:hypothetical protein
MARDLFAERGIVIPKKSGSPTRDLFAERGIVLPKKQLSRQQQIWDAQAQLTPQEALVSELMSGVTGGNTSFANTSHGIIQPFAESEFSSKYLDPIANFLRPMLKKYLPENLKPQYEGMPISEASRSVANRREADYKAEKELNPLSAMGGYAGGEVAKTIPGFAAGGTGLLPMGRNLSTLAGSASLGGISGASQYVNPGDSRASNAATGFLAGLATPLGNALYNTTMAGGRGIRNTTQALRPQHLAHTVNATGHANSNLYRNQLFPEFYQDFAQAGGGFVTPPRNINYNRLRQRNPGDLAHVLREFQANPTPEVASRLRSDLGNEIHDIYKSSATQRLSSLEKRNLRDLRNARRHVSRSLTDAFNEVSPEFTQRYRALNNGYRRDVVPYNTSPTIAAYRRNEMGDPAFLYALGNEEKFMHRVGRREHPALETRKYIPTFGKGLGIGTGIAGTALGGALGYNHFFGGNHD